MSAIRENPSVKYVDPALKQTVEPLNTLDDPFTGLSDKQIMKQSDELQEALIVRLLVEDLERGMYSIGRIKEKFLGNETWKPFPWLTPERLTVLLAKATNVLTDDNPIDIALEVSGYLASNLGLQATLYEMLDTTKSERSKIEITRTLNTLKKERLEFLRSIGKDLAEAEANPEKKGMLPPGAIPVTDLLKQGAVINAVTDTPDEYKGILTSGDLASEERRGRDAARELEGKQDPIRTAGLLP